LLWRSRDGGVRTDRRLLPPPETAGHVGSAGDDVDRQFDRPNVGASLVDAYIGQGARANPLLGDR
jgi:hypothetical protein